MLAAAIVIVIVAVVLAVGFGESFWRSDSRRRRDFYRAQDRGRS